MIFIHLINKHSFAVRNGKAMFFLFCLVFLTSGNISAQQSADSLIFDREVVDLGVVPEGDTVFKEFYIYNHYTDTVSIQQIKGTCGCTVPEYGKQYLAPGDSLKVSFYFKSKGFKHEVIKHILVLTAKGEAIYTFKVFVKPLEN
jgi:hypothetical protein